MIQLPTTDQIQKNNCLKVSYSFKLLLSLIFVSISSIGLLKAQIPTNDLCENAELIPTPPSMGGMELSGTGSTLMATSTNFPPSCGTGVDNSTSGGIWYTFEGESNTLYSLSTCDPFTDFDTEISVHTISGTGSCMTSLACEVGNDNDVSCSSNGNRSTVSIFTPIGFAPSSYYVYVTGEGTATGNVQLSLVNGPPLPVELISFEGSQEDKNNKLSWRTASEFNTERFALERSFDGSSDWREIGDIEAVGFSSEIQHYEFEDFDPPPKAFYRLRSIDFDGEEELSKIVFLERKANEFDFISLNPNPVKQVATLRFNIKNNSIVTYTLINIQGSIIRAWSSDVERGVHAEEIDLSALHSGVYIIQMNNGSEVASERILRL